MVGRVPSASLSTSRPFHNISASVGNTKTQSTKVAFQPIHVGAIVNVREVSTVLILVQIYVIVDVVGLVPIRESK